jgi:2-methylcitrate dehydratase PrpD
MTTPHAPGLSLALARHVAGAGAASLPAATQRATKRALLDAIGVIAAASGLSQEAKPFVDLAISTTGRPEASILGTGLRVAATRAALANGALSHALDYEDAFDAAPVHPDASLVPAVLALAESSELPVAGGDVLAAIAVGCDIACRLGLALVRPLEHGGWYPPPILGAMGAVAGAARLLSLEPRQVLDAWSLMLLQNSCSGQIIHSADSTIRAVREAFPAQAAVDCVRLARAGVRGFAEPFEGAAGFFAMFAGGEYLADVLLSQLGQRWLIDELSFKPWPSCRGTHAAIECALRLRADVAIDPAAIERIVVEGGTVQSMLANPIERKQAPRTAIDAKFSLPWTIALALREGTVSLESFDGSRLSDPDIRSLAARVEFRLREDWGRRRATSGALELHLQDGTVLRHLVEDPLGSPVHPMDEAGLREKFADCLARARRPRDGAQARAIADRILALDQEPDVRLLIAEV